MVRLFLAKITKIWTFFGNDKNDNKTDKNDNGLKLSFYDNYNG